MAAPNSCLPCDCIPGNVSEEYFRAAALNALCLIVSTLESGGGAGTDVNVLSVVPGVGATNLGKAEDAVAASGDVGVAALFKRTDTPSVQTTTDGDYTVPVANSFGAPQINIDSGFQRAAATGLLKLEDTVHVTGDAGVMSLGVINTSRSVLAAEGDYAPIGLTTQGSVIVSLDATSVTSAGNQPVRLEDAAFANADAVMMAGAVNARSFAAYNSTNGDVTPISVGDKGVVLTTLMYDSSMGGGSCAVGLEDQAVGNGQAAVIIGAQRQDTPANNTDADLDLAFFKGNVVGAIYTEQANQVAVPALGTLAFGGVTTAYATLLTNAVKGLLLSIDNKLDKDVYISTNASIDHYFIAAGGSKILDLGANGRWVASNISVKSLVANATSGNIYATVVS